MATLSEDGPIYMIHFNLKNINNNKSIMKNQHLALRLKCKVWQAQTGIICRLKWKIQYSIQPEIWALIQEYLYLSKTKQSKIYECQQSILQVLLSVSSALNWCFWRQTTRATVQLIYSLHTCSTLHHFPSKASSLCLSASDSVAVLRVGTGWQLPPQKNALPP